MACGFNPCQPVAPVYSGCNTGCGGYGYGAGYEQLAEPSSQYYYVNQGPTYTGPGAFAPTGLLVTHNMLEAAFLADKIVVLGGKPARTIATIAVNLPRPRDPEDPELFAVHRRIMGLLSQ